MFALVICWTPILNVVYTPRSHLESEAYILLDALGIADARAFHKTPPENAAAKETQAFGNCLELWGPKLLNPGEASCP